MTIDVELVPREETLALRELYRKEMDCQIIHDSWHGRGWTDSYLLRLDGRVVGLRARRRRPGRAEGDGHASSTSCPLIAAGRSRCSAGSSRPAGPG